MRALFAVDGFFSKTRPAWVGLGQIGLAILGVHLAADRLDDHLLQMLLWLNDHAITVVALKLGTSAPMPDQFESPSMWAALGLELVLDVYLFNCLALTPQDPRLSWETFKRRLSVEAVLVPLFWAPVALAGAWVVGMAVEDTLMSLNEMAALALGWLVAALVAWRLAWTGWKRVVGGLAIPRKRWRGLPWAPALILVGVLATWHGLPIWGWLS
jgi:hypothetical protein